MIKAGGLTLDQVQNVTVAGLTQGIEGLTEGTLDATSIAVGIPLTQQAHATIPGGIRYLSITGAGATDENLDSIFAGTYLLPVKPNPRLPEVTEPVTVLGYDVFLTTSADMPDEEATAILEALYAAWPQIRKDYPAVASGVARADGQGVEHCALPPGGHRILQGEGALDRRQRQERGTASQSDRGRRGAGSSA